MSTSNLRMRSFRSFARRGVACRGALLAFGLSGLLASEASASPALLAGTGQEKVHSTQVVVMTRDEGSAVTIMPDYSGPLAPFAMIIPVPADVDVSDVAPLKREFVNRLEQVTAPRFAEFWELDPCDEGEVQQTWEQSTKASDTSGFLGVMKTDPSKKVATELLLDVEAQKKDGSEYNDMIVGSADELKAWLSKHSFSLPTGGEAAISEYAGAGLKFLAVAVDVNRIELVGSSRAQLSPIRFTTDSQYTTVPVRFGLASAAKEQELLIFTLKKDQRMQVGNYPTKPAPTNLSVDFAIKERMGEYYANLHDRFLEKNPGTFLLEYAFSTADCGKPCPTEPVLPHELMSLGGDFFDSKLDPSIVRPEPPEATDEEKAKLDAVLSGKKGPEKKTAEEEWETARSELAYRKALIERHTYVLSRLHHHYEPANLPKDPELVGGAAIAGGNALPEGPEGAADIKVGTAAENAFQTRYNNTHEDITVLKCEAPKRYRWGKPPRSYRGSKRIWAAEDLSRKKRTQINAEEMTFTAVPELGYPGKSLQKAEEPAVEAAAPAEEKSSCGCRSAGVPTGSGWPLLAGLVAGAAMLRRRFARRA